MSEIKIQITASAGNSPETRIFFKDDSNDVAFWTFSVGLSRLLTNTTNEAGGGIFDGSSYPRDMYRGDASVEVAFPRPWDSTGKTVVQLLQEIAERVALVNEAFVEKYPAVNDFATLNLETGEIDAPETTYIPVKKRK